MSIIIPTTQQQTDANVAKIESKLNQTTPAADKAFNRVMAVMQALQHTSLYKYAAERMLQNFATTATGSDLDIIGGEYNVPRNVAIAAQLTIELPATTGTVIPQGTQFRGFGNGMIYTSDSAITSVANIATINITAEETGESGNLSVSDELTLVTPIAGAENTATVTVELTTGTEDETDTNYRIRILDRIRQSVGGGNAADYRNWAQEVSGVARAYPVTGLPWDDPLFPGSPPDRTVYIEATPDIDPEGIAPAGLLTSVRSSITTDPITGQSRQPLGLTDETLYVESIYRTGMYVQIADLTIAPELETQCKADISTELENYFSVCRPFIDGLDIESEKNSVITTASVSSIVNAVVKSYGGTISLAGFSDVEFSTVPMYTLGQGELVKLAGINYV